ncbi:MAG: YfhO family protein [Myxococcota bacterium]|nr:YfhO family protein [Myxococcota bacterium]
MRRLGPGIALIAALAWIYRHLFRGELLAGRDVLRLAYPDAHYLLRCLRNGELPLWIPNVFLGQPFAATLQSQAFYPPRVLFTVLFGPYWGVSLLQPLHAGLAAWGVFAAARALGRSRLAASLAGGAFGLSPLFTEMSGTPNLVSAAAWSGFLLAAALRTGTAGGAVRLAAGVALSALAGSPETLLWQALIVFAVVTVRGRARGLWLVGSWLWGGALAACVLIPGVELAMHSSRSEGKGSHLDWSASWAQLAALGWPQADLPRGPYWGGDQWLLLQLFLGTSIGALALLAVSRRRRSSRALAAVTTVLLLLALGRHFPPSEWVLSLPGLRSFRYPAKALVGASFGLSLLAAFGLDRVRALARRCGRGLGITVAGMALILFGVFAVMQTLEDRQPLAGGPWVAGVLLLGWLAIRTWPAGRRRGPQVAFAVAAIAAVELFVFHLGVGTSLARVERLGAPSGLAPLAGEGRISVDYRSEAKPGAAERIEVTRGLDPVAEASRQFLLPNRFVEEGLLALEGYGAPEPPRIQQFQLARQRAFYDLAGVGLYVRAEHPPFADLTELSSDLDGPSVSRSTTAFPRAFVVHRAEVLAGEAQVLEAITGPRQPARDTVFFSAPTGGELEEQPPCTGSAARLTGSGANFVEITVSACAAGFLVLSDAFFPGWTAHLDGQQVPVLRANHVMRAVRLPAGEHRVVFRYRPWSFLLGAGSSLLALAAAVGLLFRERRTNRGSAPPAPSHSGAGR